MMGAAGHGIRPGTVLTHYFQSRILWLQGFTERALRVVDPNIEADDRRLLP